MSTELIDQLINDNVPQFLDDLHSMRVDLEVLEGDVSTMEKSEVQASILAARASSLEEEVDFIRQIAQSIDTGASNLASSAEKKIENPGLRVVEKVIGQTPEGYRENEKMVSFRTEVTLPLSTLQRLKEEFEADDVRVRGEFINIVKGRS